jgi:RNAse (barnase) inhibitor barstar
MTIDSIRFKTYNNVIDTIKCVGENHYQIQAVTTGDIWDIDLNKNTLFPLLHINTINVNASKGQLQHNFQLVVADIVEPNESENEQEVLSDTLAIMLDIISIFRSGSTLYLSSTSAGQEARYFTADDFTLEPFTERFDNTLAGWTLNLPIVIEWVYDTCNIPTAGTICVK